MTLVSFTPASSVSPVPPSRPRPALEVRKCKIAPGQEKDEKLFNF